MDSIRQDILPDPFSPTIQIGNVPKGQAEDAIRHLAEDCVPGEIAPIGVAYHVSNTGQVDFITLANTKVVYKVSILNRRQLDPNSGLACLLSAGGDVVRNSSAKLNPRFCLVGFCMADTTVHISHATQS